MNVEESPRALQLAVRVEKAHSPMLSDVFAATGLAVISLLDDHRSLEGGEWQPAVSDWNGARIRKIVRRARGAAWERARAVPGRTIHVRSASVRAFVPGRLDEAPREVSKLQIQSTPLPEPDRVMAMASVEVPTLLVALNPSVDMSWGKRAAQVGHAAQRCWESFSRTERLDWNAGGRAVEVVTPAVALWEDAFTSARTRIHDGGFTEVVPGTHTASAMLQRPK